MLLFSDLQMLVLNNAIYRVMRKLKIPKTQEPLLGYLYRNRNRAGGMTYTVMDGSFNLRLHDLIEYFAHSLTFVFLFAPLIKS